MSEQMTTSTQLSQSEKQQLSFDQDLWDQLPKLANYNRHGTQMLNGLKQFATSYSNIIRKFSKNLRICSHQLESDFLRDRFQYDDDEDFTTLAIAVKGVKMGLDSLAFLVEETTISIAGDYIEPIESFTNNYQVLSSEYLERARESFELHTDNLAATKNARDRYFDLKEEAEKQEVNIEEAMLSHDRGLISIDKVQRISKKGIQVKYKAELANQTYSQSVAQLNQVVNGLATHYSPQLQRLQQLEESRINFLKQNIEKLLKSIAGFGATVSQSASKMLDQSSFISSDTDMKVFINTNKSDFDFPKRMVPELYVPSENLTKYKSELRTRQILETADVLDDSDEELVQTPEEKVRRLLCQLTIDHKPVTKEEQAYLNESVKLPEVRQLIQEFLIGFSSPRNVQKPECLQAVGKVIKALLDVIAKEYQTSNKDLHAIMQVSQLLFYFQGSRKVFLSSEIEQHSLWQNSEMWQICVSKIINFKFHEAIRQMESKQLEEAKKEVPLATVAGGWLFGKIQSMTGSKDKTPVPKKQPTISKTLAQNIVFNNLSQFTTCFVNLKLAFEPSRELLMFFCKKYELDQSRTHLLLSELESVQKSQAYVLSSKDLNKISKQKKEARASKFGQFLVLGLVRRYISTDQDLQKLLLLSKPSHDQLAHFVYKQALLKCEPGRLHVKRIPIWSNILQLKGINTDYAALKAKVIESPDLISNVEEVIMLDVQRSAYNMPGVDPGTLTMVLKTYAYFNPEFEYCQGMNFIVGFLLMIFGDEQTAFKVLQTLVKRFKMADLFNQELPKLKLYFFQLDRLLAIVDQSLHGHFKEECVNSSYFASAWFITLFTNSLKQNQSESFVVNQSLLQLWDYFLIVGWDAILETGLYLLKLGSQDLQQLVFEDILSDITMRPQRVLTEVRAETLYFCLKREFSGMHLDYHLQRVNEEFQMSHKNVSLSQPLKNNQITPKHLLPQQKH